MHIVRSAPAHGTNGQGRKDSSASAEPTLHYAGMDHRGHPTALLVLLLLISAFSIVGEQPPEALRAFLLRSLPALILLGIHGLLHVRGLGMVVLYHGVQSVLVAAIGIVSASVSPVITLTAWMCGETVAAETNPRTRVIGTIWHAVVGLLLIVLVAGAQSALQWIVAAVPTVAFVIVVIRLYARESRARESAQELARELADSNRRIAEYAEQAAFRGREQERQRVARDLHDTLAQGLTGVILQIRAAGAHLAGGRSDAAGAILTETLDQAQQALGEARRAIQDLREADAYDGGGGSSSGSVSDFLGAFCGDLSRRHARPVGLVPDADGHDVRLPGSTLFELSSVLQEAVHNAVRHGGCRRVEVRMRAERASLHLEIADDGSGFDVRELPERGHYGIQGMRERAEALGGELRVRSSIGTGTTVTVAVPLPDATIREANGA